MPPIVERAGKDARRKRGPENFFLPAMRSWGTKHVAVPTRSRQIFTTDYAVQQTRKLIHAEHELQFPLPVCGGYLRMIVRSPAIFSLGGVVH